MIKISNEIIEVDMLSNKYPLTDFEKEILNQLYASKYLHQYNSIDELFFELKYRLNIVKSSIDLNKSRMQFKKFRNSECNPKFWNRTDEGGFLLKDGIKASDAINDIFNNGSQYGTECSTAIVIIFYKGLLNIIPNDLFDHMFSNIYLMNWLYIDKDLDVTYYRQVKDYLPGDCRYFKNPDVDPLTPEWKGLNVIDMGNDKYYGHDAGIKSGEKIIKVLNKHRGEDATESAYLTDSVTIPDFKYIFDIYINYNERNQLAN